MRRRRSQRKRQKGWLDAIARLPWWLSLLLAVLAFMLLRYVTEQYPETIQGTTDVGHLVSRQLFIMFASIGQYLLPLVLVIGALLSVISGLSRLSKREKVPKIGFPKRSSGRRPSERRGETDFYPIYKEVGADKRDALDTQSWNLKLLKAIDWKRFEEVCAEYFRLCGFEAVTQTHGPDGGIDIRLYAPGGQTCVENIVQCKQYSDKKIKVGFVRELKGVMAAEGVKRGMFVTASEFTLEARQWAEKNTIFSVDGVALLAKIRSRSTIDQQRLLAIATEGDYLTPTCANCGIKMVERTGKHSRPFWGCRNFPKCRSTLNISAK